MSLLPVSLVCLIQRWRERERDGEKYFSHERNPLSRHEEKCVIWEIILPGTKLLVMVRISGEKGMQSRKRERRKREKGRKKEKEKGWDTYGD